MRPDLSILTITYGPRDDFERTVRSLVRRPLAGFSFEHIVIDQSPSADYDVKSLFPGSWPLVLEEHASPLGIFGALNRAMDRATGRWIWILHAGDELRDVDLLEESMRDLVTCGDESKSIVHAESLYRKGSFLYTRRSIPNSLIAILGHNGLSHVGMILSRDAYERVGSEFSLDFPITADYLMHWRMYLEGVRFEFDSRPLVNFDMSGASSDWKKSLEEMREIHFRLHGDMPRSLFLANRVAWWLERARFESFATIKSIPSSSLRVGLEAIWQKVFHR